MSKPTQPVSPYHFNYRLYTKTTPQLNVQLSLATSHSRTTYNFLHCNCILYSSLRVMHPCGLELVIALGTFSMHFVLLPRLPSLLPQSHLTCHLSSKTCQLS